MADVGHWYGNAPKEFLGSSKSLLDGNVKALLCDSTYVPDIDADVYLDDVTGELVDASYGRVTLTTPALSYDAANNRTKFTFDPIVFSDLDDTFRVLVLFYDTGVAGTSPLLKYTLYDADKTASAADATFTPDPTNGSLRCDVS